MIEIKEESLKNCANEIKLIMNEHWEEVAFFKESVPLDVEEETYLKLNDEGKFIVITMREGGELIGYSMYQTGRYLTYKLNVAFNSYLFLTKERRKGGMLGIKLITESDNILINMKRFGKINYHVTANNDFGRVLERLGYVMEEKLYGRLINA